jgi:hypothetical protein
MSAVQELTTVRIQANAILPVGKDLPTDDDIADISKTGCIHCNTAFYPITQNITFVRVERGTLIWWHRQGTCPA